MARVRRGTAPQLRRMLSECACLNLRKAARAVTQQYDSTLRPAGVRSTQLPLLTAAALYGTINMTELAHEVVMDQTSLTRTLALLERRGWIRVAPGADRRTREARLTPRGRRVLERAVPLWEAAQAAVTKPLQRRQFRRLLSQLNAVLSAAQPG